MINQKLLNEISLRFGQNDFHDQELISSIFEEGFVDLPIDEIINSVNFNFIDKSNDNLLTSNANEYMKLKSTPSQIHHFIENEASSLTQSKELSNGNISYILFKIQEDKITSEIERLLVFLGISNTENILLSKEIFNEHSFDCLSEIKEEYTFLTKNFDLKKKASDYEILSLTHQQAMKTSINSLFNFNKCFNLDSVNSFQKLQYFHIMQSIRYFHYRNLKPLFSHYYIKFNRVKHISERNGVLFFLINFKSSPSKNTLNKLSMIHYLISLGYLILWPDGLEEIDFKITDSTNKCGSPDLSIKEDSIYFLLFRLLDSSISDKYPELDSLIMNKDYHSFDSLVFKLISSN